MGWTIGHDRCFPCWEPPSSRRSFGLLLTRIAGETGPSPNSPASSPQPPPFSLLPGLVPDHLPRPSDDARSAVDGVALAVDFDGEPSCCSCW